MGILCNISKTFVCQDTAKRSITEKNITEKENQIIHLKSNNKTENKKEIRNGDKKLDKILSIPADPVKNHSIDPIIVKEDDFPSFLTEKPNKTETPSEIIEHILKGIKNDFKSMWTPIFKDNSWVGVFTKISSQPGANNIVWIWEWFIQYSDALKVSICGNVSTHEISRQKLGYGLKFLIFGAGYGDGFYRSYLSPVILKKTWEIFQLHSIFTNDYIAEQFSRNCWQTGVVFDYKDSYFASLTFAKFSQLNNAINLNCHFLSNDIFIAVYVSVLLFKIKVDLSLFNETGFIYCDLHDTMKELLVGINLMKLIFSQFHRKKLIYLLLHCFSFLINYQHLTQGSQETQTSKNQFICAIIIQLSVIQLVIVYEAKSGFKILLTIKYSTNGSLIDWFSMKEKNIENSATYLIN
jgi:hypothetical protein